ncbi:presenilin-like protein [Plasmopara halstedii]|uniref:Presenilin-like protein n=1 Tax=Plasmopara halstedii TaxID=4781 RepID=A0A0P1A481_PLAHL|nr:presenilin-like protein [Plasmopara halstedii]CEG35234.1 presenilin-like protein [Plasmopara halstedii]|eukprot:XP_024571603.1 presenilin-like protein [Plasmopara halstedii]
MGNARSLVSANYFSFAGTEGNPKLYEEPLLDKRRVYEVKELRLQQSQQVEQCDFKTVIHQLNSFFAVVWPVSIAMICSSLAVSYISDPIMKRSMAVYMYYQDIDSSRLSTAEKTEEAFLNALLVIVVIALLTFGIVLLYKCNGMHFFAWYCMLYSAVLLGLIGSKLVVIILCENLHWVIDRISLTVVMYNFATVGVLSIFYQKGIPSSFERGYLIATSIIVTWQLAQLPEWSIWMLLFLLGFWDLFAVLTPVGPLRCLIDLIHEKGTPISGLLFEANVRDAHIDDSKQIQRQAYTTRGNVPEQIFIQRLLLAEQTISVLQDHEAVNANLFRNQVQAFLIDQSSQCQDQSEELARKFERNQLRLWQILYKYYGIDYVSSLQPYPGIRSVFPASLDTYDEADSHDGYESKSIKLGLGDFIFYSVLVARASLHGFDVFAACSLSILVGLGITLYLLASFDSLPALPISLFLGIITYLLMVTIISPLLDELQIRNITVL